MNRLELIELVELIEKSSIDSFELTHNGTRLRLKRGTGGKASSSLQALPTTAILETASEPAAVSDGAARGTEERTTSEASAIQEVASNWVGAFQSAVKIGDVVKAGQVVCYCHVECLTLTHEMVSPVSGEIIDIIVEDGQFVDYGQPLLIVKVDPRRKKDV